MRCPRVTRKTNVILGLDPRISLRSQVLRAPRNESEGDGYEVSEGDDKKEMSFSGLSRESNFALKTS